MFAHTSKARKLFKRNRVLFPPVILVLLIFALSISLKPAAGEGSGGLDDVGVAFTKTVDSQFAKPSDRVNFTLSYLNNLGESAYNVTVYDSLTPELTFAGSRPFYDGSSDSEVGFYRWSRGTVSPGGYGTIVLSVLVNEAPVNTEITNTAYLAYEFGNGTKVEVASSAAITVTQAAGVDVFPDQIHSVAPKTGAQTEYNITLKNTGNAVDIFNVILRSVAYSPSGSAHDWRIELFNSTGYFLNNPVAVVYDYNSNNRTSWTDHGVVTSSTLAMSESTWFILRVTEAEGTSGSGDALLEVQFIARSSFDPRVYNGIEETTIVRSVAGLTFAPNYSKEANPGDTVTFNHIIVNSGQSDVVDLSYVSPMGWNYTFFNADGTPLVDSDGSGYVDVGLVPKNGYMYVLVKVAVPYSTPAGTVDNATITARGVSTGNYDVVNDITTVRSAPMLIVNKRLVTANPGYEGDVVTYEVYIVNLGNTRLIKIPLDDTFETVYLDFSSAQPAEDSFDEVAGNIHWESLGALEPSQSVTVTISFVAIAGSEAVRESANVIDAEDEFGNLISATCINADLHVVGAHTLTVTASPVEAVGGNFSVTWTDHGVVNSAVFTTPKIVSCDEGTIVTISHPESPINDGDNRYVFVDYQSSAVLSMDSDKLVTLTYRTEYVLRFDQAGSSEPVYIVVDGIQLSDALPKSFWVEKGSVVSFSYPSVVTDSVGTTRYVLIEVSGSDTSASVSVNAPTVVLGLYKTQYYLTVTTIPEGLENLQFSGWYDEGTVVNLAVSSIVSVSDGVRYRFDQWVVDTAAFADNMVSVSVNAPMTATAEFVVQFRVVVVSEHDTPEPTAGEYWYDIDSSVAASVTSPADESSGVRYKCLGWVGTGSVVTSGYGVSTVFTVTAPSSIEWVWMRQYYLTVITDPAGLDAPSGEGWYDEGVYASISVGTPTGGDGVGSRYRFDNWVGIGVAQPIEAETTIKMDSAKFVQAAFVKQFYLTMSTNLGEVTPESGWYDVGSIVSIEAFAPTVVQGKGYVWHGWTGTREVSYSGIDNPVEVTINGVITETAAWKIDPVVTVAISNETIANGDRIVVYGETSPAQSGVAILIVYDSPSGSVVWHTVYTDDEGKFEDTLALDEGYFYPLFVESGEWGVSAFRQGDVVHEAGQASAALSVESRSVSQFPPVLLAGVVMVFGLVAFVPPTIKKKNGNGWRRVAMLLCIVGIILGLVSLALNWVVVAGSVTNNGVISHVDVQLYPLSRGVVSISDGIGYVGPAVSSLVQMGSSPVLALLLIPVGCGLAMVGLYKPKNVRQRNLKTAALIIAGVLIASSVINTYLFVQSHANAIAGAGIGFGVGVYVAIVSCALTFVSALFATRENNEHRDESPPQLKMEEKPFFAELFPLKSEDCVRFRQTTIKAKIEPSDEDWSNSHKESCPSCESWHAYYRKINEIVDG